LKHTTRKLSKLGIQNCGCEICTGRSVVLTCRAPIGNVKIPEFNFSTNQGCKALTQFRDHSPDYLYYYLLSCTDALQNHGNGTTFLELSSRSLRDFKTPYPPLKEQRKIIQFLDRKCQILDKITQEEDNRINLLTEYRQSLISEVVTGKIDVRDEVIS
jgi:restriction endonuclease S subunit